MKDGMGPFLCPTNSLGESNSRNEDTKDVKVKRTGRFNYSDYSELVRVVNGLRTGG